MKPTSINKKIPPEPQPSERLALLRAELRARNLDGFLIPRSDEHQGEYVAPHAERLAWLTGFTGSAGIVIVSLEKAALFTDGRYTLQASVEIDTNLYECLHSTKKPLGEWIINNMQDGQNLGYDPWLFTPTQLRRYANSCENSGIKLVAAESNPIDVIWKNQPPRPTATVSTLDEVYTGESSCSKRERIAESLTHEGSDAMILTLPDSIAWLFNIRGGDVPFTPFALSFAILFNDGSAYWFINADKLEQSVHNILDANISLREPNALTSALDELGATKKNIRVDPTSAAAWIHNRLSSAGANIIAKEDLCQLAKAIKNDVQQSGMRTAHVRDGVAMVRFLAWLFEETKQNNVTEARAADVLENFRRVDPAFRGLSFPTISGFGSNGAIVHYKVSQESNLNLEPGSLYLVDSGAQYPDGTTDVTRTIAIGRPSDEMCRHFTLVLKGHIALACAVFPKHTTGSQLDVLARQALWRAGLDYDHGTGHGVGSFLSVHEGPQRISKLPSTISLEPGMVISNEPGFYLKGAYGIRIENLVMVKEATGDAGVAGFMEFETLTLAPIDRSLIIPNLLTPIEIAWLNEYHLALRNQLSGLLDASVAAWLTEATQPLDVADIS
ncbi:MAG: X-Pro aminopeptidase [Magnetovibrio sp.]|nr:X-Pro aminopeptidase [Magnetovibrio sp.]|tara:strand:+ start:1472 stop:3310 length:1839 start_codon:yes stop_codon:yes gene_type:complete